MAPSRARRVLSALIAVALAASALLTIGSPGAAARPRPYDPNADWDASSTPYLGWSSWSMQATRADGTNAQGSYSWLTEENLLAQVDYMAAKLKRYGYEYINIDAGWWRTWNWTPVYDEHGRPAVWEERLPSGMAEIVDYIHSKGLKVGIYMPVGMEAGDEGDNTEPIDLTQRIEGAPSCTLADALYPADATTGEHPRTNGWDSSYALDFTDTSDNCAQAYIDSIVDLFESWGGVDLLKIDGVSPGSGHNDITGANYRYDNRADIAAYDRAFQATGRHVEIQVSWSINQDYISDFQQSSDSWRTDFDVECYCSSLTTWSAASNRLDNALDWAEHAGPETGWSNLDSLIAGPNPLSGLTDEERRTVVSIWSIASSPLYLGDDLRDLDSYGLKLVTNRDVLAVDQDPLADTLSRVSQSDGASVVARQLDDGDLVVGFFNLGDTSRQLTTSVTEAAEAADLDLPHRRSYLVTDLWSGEEFQTTGRLSEALASHGASLYRISASPRAAAAAPSAVVDLVVGETTLAPGETTEVSATVTNTSAVALTKVSVGLGAEGWTTTAVSGTSRKSLSPGESMTTRFRVTAPASPADPISVSTLRATARFTGHRATRTAESVAAIRVVSPVQEPLRTANTTGADAVFGQSGEELAISGAGASFGPAQGGPGGTTPAGDDYAALYIPAALDADDSLRATVTGQGGGSSAKAGIIARDDMDAGATPVGVALYLSNGRVSLVYNNSAAGGTSYTTRLGAAPGPGAGTIATPVELRLVRAGATYTGSYSVDGGSSWTTVGAVTANGQGSAQDAGVFQSAGSDSATLAGFEGLSVS